MVESVFHFLKIHRKMIFGNSPVIVQNVFSKTPKTLNAVNMILRLLIDQRFRVIQGMMLSQALQRVVASEGIGVVNRTLPRFLSDNRHKLIGRHMLHNPRVYLPIPFQKPKYDVFALGPTSALALASAAEVAFVHFDLAVQSAALKLGYVVDRFTETLIDAGDRLIIKSKIVREAVGRLLLVKSLHDANLGMQTLQRLLFSTGLVPAPDVAALCTINFERTAENALFTSQKVGRATENILFCCNHKGILPPRGYETH